jgi:hypothetical protein
VSDQVRPPDEAAIRRALADCMTLADIDDAMGWRPGTARRRRWRNPPAGLPPADAELGGVALWFRTTIEHWRTTPTRPAAATAPPLPSDPPPHTGHDEHEDVESSRPEIHPDPERTDTSMSAQPYHAQTLDSDDMDEAASTDAHGSSLNSEGQAPQAPQGAHPDSEDITDDDTEDSPGPTPLNTKRPHDHPRADHAAEPRSEHAGQRDSVGSGFELELGQQVLAFVHKRWHPASVAARDRRTVVVDYQVGDTPLGQRRQRLTLDRIHLPADRSDNGDHPDSTDTGPPD